MVEITKEQMLKLHRSSVVMHNAWVTYAPTDLQAEWKKLKGQSSIEALQRDVEAASEIDGDISTKLMRAFSGLNALTSARTKLQSTLQANILSYIRQGHLHGFGYELPRTVSSIPVAIPKEAWGGRCDWGGGTLSYRGLEFVDVRLTTNRIRNEILERGVVDKTPTSPAGRPGVGSAIEAAFHALHKAGEIDPNGSRSSHYPKVRAWLELNRPNLSVPPATISEKTIYKYFSPLFKGL